MDQLYYESGYLVDGYFVYTADAGSAVNSASTIACNASVIAGGMLVEGTGAWLNDSSITAQVSLVAGGAASMTIQFTQTATISHINGADLFAFTEASLAVQVSLIRDNNIQAQAAFTIATDASRTRTYSSEDSAAFSMTADNLRVRYDEAALSAAFSMSADAEVIVGGITQEAEALLVSAFTQTVDTDKIVSFAVEIFSEFAQTVDATRIQQFNSVLTSTVLLSTPGEKIIQGASVENSAFTPSLTVDVFKNSFAVLDSTTTVVAWTVTIKSTPAALASTASLSATVNRTKSVNAQMAATATSQVYNTFKNSRPHAILRRYGLGANAVTPMVAVDLDTTQYYKGNSSLKVEGYDSYFETGSHGEIISNNFNFAANQDFVISFRLKLTNATSLVAVPLLSTNSTTGWEIGLSITTSRPYFKFHDGTAYRTLTMGSNSYPAWSEWTVTRSGSTITFKVGSLSAVTYTYSGAITDGGAGKLKIGQIVYQQTENITYWDELYIAKGINSVQNYFADGRIADGALDSTTILYHFDNSSVNEDLNGYRNASAALSAVATLTAIPAPGISNFKADLQSTATISAQPLRIKSSTADLQSNGFVVVAIGRIRPFVDIEIGTFTVDITPSVIRTESAALNSSADIVVNENIYKGFAATLDVAFTDVSNGALVANAESQLTSFVEITTAISPIRTTAADLKSDGFLIAATGRIRPFVDIEVSTFSLAVDSQVVKVAESSQSATTALTADAYKMLGKTVVNAQSTVTLTATGKITSGSVVSMFAQSTASATAVYYRNFDSQQSVNSNLQATTRIIRGFEIAAQSEATQTALVYRIKQFDSQLLAFVTELVVINKIGEILIDMPATVSVVAAVNVQAAFNSALTATAELMAVTSVTRVSTASLAVDTTLSAVAESGIIGESQMHAVSTMSASAVKNTVNGAAITSSADLTATALRIRPGISIEWSLGTLTAQVGVIKQYSAAINANAQAQAQATKIVQGTAALQCEGFELVFARVINLDSSITYRVQPENRSYQVYQETNYWRIVQEDRTYKIKG